MSNLNHLTKREREVASLLVEGKSNAQIAIELDISEKTVEYHLTNIYKKLGVSSAKEAIPLLGKSLELFKPGEPPVESTKGKGNNGNMNLGKNGIKNSPLLITLGLIIILGLVVAYYIFCIVLDICPFSPTNTPTATSYTSTLHPTSTKTQPTVTHSPTITPSPISSRTPTSTPAYLIEIMLDDFNIPPYLEESVYPYNRLQGNRGIVNGSVLEGGNGLITSTIGTGNTWGGAWMSLNHPIEENLSINFSRILPSQIRPEFQSQFTGLRIQIKEGTSGRPFKVELKDGDEVRWVNEITLTGQEQILKTDLPPLSEINQLVWIIDQGLDKDYVVLDSIIFTATTPISDTATAAFVWSYGMLLNNWNPDTGLVRDKARDPSGKFDGIQVTGSLAAATAMAYQLGVIDDQDAVQIIDKISETLLFSVPKRNGLWPHWMQVSQDGKIDIASGTEWSSVDTVIAAIGLLTAQGSLGLDTSSTESMIQAIDWDSLQMEGGISHGYDFSGVLIPYAWDVFGSESWLVELAYAAATGNVSVLPFSEPPTANGSGFIDEMAWLFVSPPEGLDYWSNDWNPYRVSAAERQIGYYGSEYPNSCLAQVGLFGLSAGEIPSPSTLRSGSVYQAFGVGGRFADANNGSTLLNISVAVPHYAGLVASLQPEASIQMWNWLMDAGYFSPLTNVESLAFPDNSNCGADSLVWNQLKGSWNLSLQTLGVGRYLAEQKGEIPILWQAAITNSFLQEGYHILANKVPSETPLPSPAQRVYARECENPDEYTVGQTLERENASEQKVHGQFGTTSEHPWSPLPGFVKYINIDLPQTETLFLKLRYSKNSETSTPILIFIDEETTPRASFYPENLGDWENFAWSEAILLGNIESGPHTITLSTDGQQYGTADLDRMVLEVGVVTPNE